MGYETFLMEIRLEDSQERQKFISDLMKRNFSLSVAHNNSYLEKTYSSGIVEICFSCDLITFRYAKPNLQESLTEFLNELQDLSEKYNLYLSDPCNNEKYTPIKFNEVALMFERSRDEFTKNYSGIMYPIKSEDVLKQERK